MCIDRLPNVLLFIHLNGGECQPNITSINNTSKVVGGHYLSVPGVLALPQIMRNMNNGIAIARPSNI